MQLYTFRQNFDISLIWKACFYLCCLIMMINISRSPQYKNPTLLTFSLYKQQQSLPEGLETGYSTVNDMHYHRESNSLTVAPYFHLACAKCTEQFLNGRRIKRNKKKQNKNIKLSEGHTRKLPKLQRDLYQFKPRFEWKATQAIPSIHETLNCPISLICALQEQKCVI